VAQVAEPKSLRDAVDAFIQNKAPSWRSKSVLGKFKRELQRFVEFCESKRFFALAEITRDLLLEYRETWDKLYPHSATRERVQSRLRQFFRDCVTAGYIQTNPASGLGAIRVEHAPTLPLTPEQYQALLEAIPRVFPEREKAAETRALVQLMRWSGLAIADAVTLERNRLLHDEARGLWRVTTVRQKTGTDVCTVVPMELVEELLHLPNGSPYFFWKSGARDSLLSAWSKKFKRLFKVAGIRGGHSHMLRNTFACDLLSKGTPLEAVSKLLGHRSVRTTERRYSAWVAQRQNHLDDLVLAALREPSTYVSR
jgi:integrase/recombinase XerD